MVRHNHLVYVLLKWINGPQIQWCWHPSLHPNHQIPRTGVHVKLLLNEGYIFWWIAFSVSAQFPVGLWCTIYSFRFWHSEPPIIQFIPDLKGSQLSTTLRFIQTSKTIKELKTWIDPIPDEGLRSSTIEDLGILSSDFRRIFAKDHDCITVNQPKQCHLFPRTCFFSYPRGTSGVARWGVLTSRGSKVTIAWTSLGWCSSKRRRANRIRCSVGRWGLTIPNC